MTGTQAPTDDPAADPEVTAARRLVDEALTKSPQQETVAEALDEAAEQIETAPPAPAPADAPAGEQAPPSV